MGRGSGEPLPEPTPAAAGICPLPIYVHLPSEQGLARLLQRRREGAATGIEHYVPLCSFGEKRDIATRAAITQGSIRDEALDLDQLHRLTGSREDSHPDFNASNLDAIVHAEVRFAALGITFHKDPPSGATPVLAPLFTDRVERAFQKLTAAEPGQPVSVDDLFEGPTPHLPTLHLLSPNLPAPNLLAPSLPALSLPALSLRGEIDALEERCALERGAFLQKDQEIGQKTGQEIGQEAGQETVRGQKGGQPGSAVTAVRLITDEMPSWDSDRFNRAVDRVIKRFKHEMQRAGRDADLVAMMEHNRWMGERLTKGWRYGAEDNCREQRPTFVPWEMLTSEERRYDRQQLPQLIVARREEGAVAVVTMLPHSDVSPDRNAPPHDEPQEEHPQEEHPRVG